MDGRRGGFGKGRHPEDASLHAWMTGELSGAEGAAISAHLSSCSDCQARVAKMEPVLEGLHGLAERDLDDVSWQRIAQAVKRELETPKRPSLAPGSAVWAQRWVSGVLVTAAVVALFVWGSPPLRLAPKDGEGPPGANLASGERGYSVRLPSGVELMLAPDTQLRLGRSEATPSLFLELGQVELLIPESIELPAGGFEVRAPAFRVSARSGRMRVGYWSREYFVEVDEGEAKLRPEGKGEVVTVQSGERRTVHLMSGPSASRIPERRAEPQAPVRVRAEAPVPEAPSAPPSALEAPAARPEAPARSGAAAPPADPSAEAPSAETQVEVIPPAPDPLRDKLLEAHRAFYEGRDVARAITLAEEVAATDAPRPEVRLAHALLCEAHLAERQPERAASACEAQLQRETDPEELREIHLKLGTIQRTLLRRCRDAIPHYSEAIVFGRVSLIDTEARLGRASCALELGELALAEQDLGLLSAAPGLHLERVQGLLHQLEILKKSSVTETGERDE